MKGVPPGTATPADAIASGPRSDGRRVLFEVLEGGERIACAISQHALRDIAAEGMRRGKAPGDLLACFAAARPRIEALTLRAIRARRSRPQGVLYIWPDDEEEPPAAPAVPAPAPRDGGRARRTG